MAEPYLASLCTLDARQLMCPVLIYDGDTCTPVQTICGHKMVHIVIISI